MKTIKTEKIIQKYIFIIALVVLAIINFDRLIGMVHVLWIAFSNIMFAAAFAYIVNIVMVRIEKGISKIKGPIIQKYKRVMSLFLSLTFIVLIIYTLIALVFPVITEAVNVLLINLPTYFVEIQSFLVNIFRNNQEITNVIESMEINWKELLENGIAFLGNGIGNVLGTTFNVITVVLGSVFNLLLVVIFSIYILLDKERFIGMYERIAKVYLKPIHKSRLDTTLQLIHQSFTAFIAGQSVEAVILGGLCAIGMFLLQLPYALMVGTLVGVFNIVPIVGAYVGGAIGVFMVFTVNPLSAVVFLVYLIVLQQIESNLIYPKVVGNSVGLPGIYVLASVMVFGSLAGVLGMFLGIPIVASLYKLGKRYLSYKERMVSNHEMAPTE
ncbi:AI-2E family transporter [Jeotgalibaca sp. MA1X17-3]|uniref:AI-2E family transporter n=1 Tax=Jeotgalibaca sp. MA1X17-3 TaxID=2908211 RepID=UPI001F41634B|nr:AI-2E family transporter [Jeotgalibaca sp. MA1X17-3]UJF14614.1 AI-2E family transporter [Jeotgalibaca sp. MA1X17-3]